MSVHLPGGASSVIEELLKWAAVLFGGGVVGALVQAFRKPSSRAELEKQALETYSSIIGELRTELSRLGERVDALEEENETCRGENRELRQHLSSLEVILRDAGIPIPAKELPGSLVVIEGRRTTVLQPRPRKP